MFLVFLSRIQILLGNDFRFCIFVCVVLFPFGIYIVVHLHRNDMHIPHLLSIYGAIITAIVIVKSFS